MIRGLTSSVVGHRTSNASFDGAGEPSARVRTHGTKILHLENVTIPPARSGYKLHCYQGAISTEHMPTLLLPYYFLYNSFGTSNSLDAIKALVHLLSIQIQNSLPSLKACQFQTRSARQRRVTGPLLFSQLPISDISFWHVPDSRSSD